jgi:hypothetical protein
MRCSFLESPNILPQIRQINVDAETRKRERVENERKVSHPT